jgi:hypothetical protein
MSNVIPFPTETARRNAWSDEDRRYYRHLRLFTKDEKELFAVVESERDFAKATKPRRGRKPKPQPLPAGVVPFPAVSRDGWTGRENYFFNYYREKGHTERQAAIIVNEERRYRQPVPGESYDEGLRRMVGESLHLMTRMQHGDLRP